MQILCPNVAGYYMANANYFDIFCRGEEGFLLEYLSEAVFMASASDKLLKNFMADTFY
ncbi:MAG: hypothetical protein HZA08_01215 [Nitrospirae bacterium]|nr:hypothetical protein [Nitrospirota bacterium]